MFLLYELTHLFKRDEQLYFFKKIPFYFDLGFFREVVVGGWFVPLYALFVLFS